MSGVYVPPRRDTSALTTILKGLSIAKDLYGMKVDSDKLEMAQQEHEARLEEQRQEEQAKKDFAAGRLNKGQQFELAKSGFVPAAKGDAGAFGYRDASSGDEVFIKPPTAAEKPMILPAGASLVQGGKIVTTAPKGQPGGGAPALVQVETVDKDGNPIITFVRKQEGAAIPISKTATASAQKSSNEAKYRYKSLLNNASRLKKLVQANGTVELTGNAGEDMDRAIYEMAIDYAKLVDPDSIAREGEVAAAQKYMLGFRQNLGMTTSNKTALTQIDNYVSSLNDRLKARSASFNDNSDKDLVDFKRSAPGDFSFVETANAADAGGNSEIAKFATDNGLDYETAAKILISRNWKPK